VSQNTKIRIITGSVTLIYWFVPVVQDILDFADKHNDHYIFSLSTFIFGFMRMTFTHDSIFSVPYIVQFSFWLLSWLLLYLITWFIKDLPLVGSSRTEGAMGRQQKIIFISLAFTFTYFFLSYFIIIHYPGNFSFIFCFPFLITAFAFGFETGSTNIADLCLLIAFCFFLIWGFLFLLIKAIVGGIAKN